MSVRVGTVITGIIIVHARFNLRLMPEYTDITVLTWEN